MIDETNTLIDLKVKLFGTKLASVYGERTNQALMGTTSKSIGNQMKLTHQRAFAAVGEMVKKTLLCTLKQNILKKIKDMLLQQGYALT